MLCTQSVHAGSRAAGVQRRTSVGVYSVFSLRRSLSSIVKQQSGAPTRQDPHRASALALEATPPSPVQLSPRKSIQGVPVNQRETVELVMALTSLDTRHSTALVRTAQQLHSLVQCPKHLQPFLDGCLSLPDS